MVNEQRQVAIAILYRQKRFLLQLRDDIPSIVYPGHWGLFGGHLERGETPIVAVKRELQEEISYIPPNLSLFGSYSDSRVIRYVYTAPLLVELDQLVLCEGWDMDLLTPKQIHQGKAYSAKTNQFQPLVPTAQTALLDFIDQSPYGAVMSDEW